MAIFDVSDLEKEYDLLVLRVAELRSDEMRKLICGNYRAKLAALWQGPFEFYVWLDSDAIVWRLYFPRSDRRRFSNFLERNLGCFRCCRNSFVVIPLLFRPRKAPAI